jgi:hypothetical protein
MLDNISEIKEQIENLEAGKYIRPVHHRQLEKGEKYYIVRKEQDAYEMIEISYKLHLRVSGVDKQVHYIFKSARKKNIPPLAFSVSHGDEINFYFFADKDKAIKYCLHMNTSTAVRALDVCNSVLAVYNSLDY